MKLYRNFSEYWSNVKKDCKFWDEKNEELKCMHSWICGFQLGLSETDALKKQIDDYEQIVMHASNLLVLPENLQADLSILASKMLAKYKIVER